MTGNKLCLRPLIAARIKNISLISVFAMSALIYIFEHLDDIKNQREPDPTETRVLIILTVAVLIGAVFFPIGHMIEKTGHRQLATYFQFGPLKFNRKTYDSVGHAVMEQDEAKYFCVSFEHSKGKFVLFRYPTMDMANHHRTIVNRLLIDEKENPV